MVLTSQAPAEDARVIDDAALLDGAAAVWAVVSFAADLPATPEHREAMALARHALRQRIEALGITEADIVAHLKSRPHDTRAPMERHLRSLLPD
jgi:hypothetical protein